EEVPGRLGGTRRESGKHSGETVGGDAFGALETCVAQHAQEELHAFLAADTFGRDGRLVNPLLQPLHGLAVSPLDLAFDGPEIDSARASREQQGSGANQAAAEQSASGESIHGAPSPRLDETVKWQR